MRAKSAWRRLAAIGLVMSLVAVGCGDDDGGDAAPEVEDTTGSDPSGGDVTGGDDESGGEDAGAAPGQVTVGAQEYAFDAPATLEGGVVELELDNQGAEEHHVQFARLNDGVTFEDFTAAFQEGEEAALPLVTFEGGVGTTVGGATSSATTDLAAGDYALICFVAGADGVPHAAKGMIQPVTVTEPSAAAPAPEGDLTVAMTDFAYELPDGFDGTGTIEFVNEGEQPHEANIVGLREGDADTFLEFFAEPAGPPPFISSGGFQAISPDAGSGFVDLSQLEPGRYAFVCFIPDAAGDGAPHFTKGMIAAFEVQ